MEIRDLTLDEYGSHLPETAGDVFHAPEALAVVDEYAQGTLRLIGGFRGQEVVGLCPVFVRDHWSFTFVMSPPPGLSVPALGPILMPTSPKRRKQEKLNERFADGVLEAVDAEAYRTAFGMGSCPAYTDPRPFLWAGFDVSPRFNYELPLADRGSDDVLGSFTRSLRSEIRKREELDITIEVEGPAEAERICRDVTQHHVEQGLTYSTPPAYSGALVEALDDRARVYVARTPDGDFLSGIIVLYSDDKARFWQGGIRAEYEGVSVNSLLHWTIIDDLLTDPALESVDRYDLGAVRNQRISRYKSKFNPELTPYYEVKSDLMVLAKGVHSVHRHGMGQLQQWIP